MSHSLETNSSTVQEKIDPSVIMETVHDLGSTVVLLQTVFSERDRENFSRIHNQDVYNHIGHKIGELERVTTKTELSEGLESLAPLIDQLFADAFMYTEKDTTESMDSAIAYFMRFVDGVEMLAGKAGVSVPLIMNSLYSSLDILKRRASLVSQG